MVTSHLAETPGLLYPAVLATCAEILAKQYNIVRFPNSPLNRSNTLLTLHLKTLTDERKATFGASVGKWPPFGDTSAALKRLQKHYKLVILSNVNRESFALSEKNMNAKFDLVCTAQDIVRFSPRPASLANRPSPFRVLISLIFAIFATCSIRLSSSLVLRRLKFSTSFSHFSTMLCRQLPSKWTLLTLIDVLDWTAPVPLLCQRNSTA